MQCDICAIIASTQTECFFKTRKPIHKCQYIYSVHITHTCSFSDKEEVDLVIAVHSDKKANVKLVKKHIQGFLKEVLKDVDLDSGAVRVSFGTFGETTDIHFTLNAFNKVKQMNKAFKKVKPGVYRSKGLDYVTLIETLNNDVFTESKGDRPGVANIVLIISDSKSTNDINELRSAADELKRRATVVAIGIEGADEEEVKALSSQPVESYAFIGTEYADMTKLPELREQLKSNIKICKCFVLIA